MKYDAQHKQVWMPWNPSSRASVSRIPAAYPAGHTRARSSR